MAEIDVEPDAFPDARPPARGPPEAHLDPARKQGRMLPLRIKGAAADSEVQVDSFLVQVWVPADGAPPPA